MLSSEGTLDRCVPKKQETKTLSKMNEEGLRLSGRGCGVAEEPVLGILQVQHFALAGNVASTKVYLHLTTAVWQASLVSVMPFRWANGKSTNGC